MNSEIKFFDERRDIVIPGDEKATLTFAIKHFLEIGNNAIQQRGFFYVALSGGSTPKAMFEKLTTEQYRNQLDWSKVFFFWSDERDAPPDSPDSNYHMAMKAFLEQLPVNPKQIFRMKAEQDIEENTLAYEELIKKLVPHQQFDLMMLGMGEDGHVASLFPLSHGLHVENRLVIANFIPSKEVWRMSFTFKCINQARNIVIYVMGTSKAATVKRIFSENENADILPAQRVGTELHKALWVLDQSAASELSHFLL